MSENVKELLSILIMFQLHVQILSSERQQNHHTLLYLHVNKIKTLNVNCFWQGNTITHRELRMHNPDFSFQVQ